MVNKKIILIMFLVLSACYTTKHVNENDLILNKNKISITSDNSKLMKEISKKEIKSIIKQKPNKKIFGIIPFHFFIFTSTNPNKNNWVNNYLRKIGEKPIIFESTLLDKSINQIQSYLENKGYFTAKIDYVKKIKNQKINLEYKIYTGDYYKVNEVNYNNIQNEQIKEIILEKHNTSLLKKNEIFSFDKVNDERVQLEKILRNNGFYKFSKDLIFIEADSTKNKKIDLDFKIKKVNVNPSSYEEFEISKVNVKINLESNDNDTLTIDEIVFIQSKYSKELIKKKLISKLIEVKSNDKYSQKNIEETYQNLSELGFFKKIIIEFEEKENNKLDCIISLETPIMMYYSLEAEAKRSADEGNLGLSAYLQFGNKNLLKGAENLNGKIKLSLENRQTNLQNDEKIFNTQEISYELGLRLPKLLIPKSLTNNKKTLQPNTNISFSFSQRRRPDFSSNVFNHKIGYSWNTSKNINHQFNLIELTFSDIGEISSYITNQIDENPYLREQFEDKFIPAMNYTFSFNNQRIYKTTNHTYFKAKAELSGNLLYLIAPFGGFEMNSSGSYEIFNNSFSQYVKLNFDLRRYLNFTKENSLIFRGFFGLGYSFLNSDELPIQKQFFSGGVNSIRAWEAFSLGPGSSVSSNNYSTGDLKIELNIEYRFPFFNSLKSAIFIDGGNIWSLKNDPRDGSKFEINNFFNQVAFGTGVGFRYDFDFFVIRLDIASKLINPNSTNKNNLVQNPIKGNFRYNLAIGYPF